tara:strand:+ start:507 stop:1100 length:594 start_codon:yes stop_codon:yes gene_type:complete
MARIWNTDKTVSLNSFIDFQLIYFDRATYMDRGETILASFENMKAGDTENNGNIVSSPYEFDGDYTNLSITNNPYYMFVDVNRQNRIHFYFNSIDGNIVGDDSLVTINIPIMGFNNKVVRLHDVIPAYVAPNGVQTPGEGWIMNEREDSTYGVDWNAEAHSHTISNPGTWIFTQGSWTDSEITINKSNFWGKDKINP